MELYKPTPVIKVRMAAMLSVLLRNTVRSTTGLEIFNSQIIKAVNDNTEITVNQAI